jgi:DNA-binding MarR family transcriptional regulator
MTHSGDKSIVGMPAALLPHDALLSRQVLSFILKFANEDKKLSTFASERVQLARELYQNRRARDRLFDAELFADPAWDILLILYCASHSQQRLSVSSVCASAGVPATTALRWIGQLCRQELICKAKSPTDGRITWLYLADQTGQRLDRYFDGILDKRASLSPARAA